LSKSRKSIHASAVGQWTVADLGSFYSKNRVDLLAYATRALKDQTRAEEVLQDSLIRVILAAPELSSEDHARAYFYRTIENLSIDIFRQEGRRPKLVLLDEVYLEELESISRHEDELVEAFSLAEDAAIIRQALSLLSPAERTALVMWEIEGRTREEISLELGIKESAVRHTLTRARSSLRRILSELVIDETRGLTALELLSSAYKGVSKVAKKSSKVALSLLLVLVGLVGFNSISGNNISNNLGVKETSAEVGAQITNSIEAKSPNAKNEVVEASAVKERKKSADQQLVKSKSLTFPGLDDSGVPTGFTVADSSGKSGSAFFFERPMASSESEVTIGHIFKTETGVANILISQALTTDSEGLSYRSTISFSQGGYWVPLNVRLIASDVTRLTGGDYLFTAYMGVESVVDSPIKIVASSNGRDLAVPPKQIIVRLVLDPSKTRVLSQAVLVVERGGK